MKAVSFSPVARENIRFFLYSLLLFLMTIPMNGFSYGWYAVLGGVCYFILACFLTREYGSPLWRIILFCLLGFMCLPFLVYVLSEFCADNVASMSFVAWNVLMGVWYGKTRSVWSVLVTICGWFYFLCCGFVYWLEFVQGHEFSLCDLYSFYL